MLALILFPGSALAEEPGPGGNAPGIEAPGIEAPGIEAPGIEAPGIEEAVGSPSEGAESGGTVGEAVEASPDTGSLEWEIEGYLKARARYRAGGSESDVDIYGDVVGDLRHRGDFPFRVRFNGRLYWDVAGNQRSDDLLRDYWDAFDGELQGRIYEAYGEVVDLFGGLLAVRGGRQYLDEGVWFHFDGIRADLDLDDQVEDLDLTVVFGVPVIITDSHRRGNWLVGAVVHKRLGPDTRVRVEYYHVSENFGGFNDPVVDPLFQPETASEGRVRDDYFGLSAWQRLWETVRLYGRFTLLNGDANELHLRGRWNSEDGVWTVVLEGQGLFDRLRNVTNDLSPYVPLLGSYEPYWRVGGRVDYRPDDDWLLQAGFAHRELTDEDDEGPLNHEFENYFASATRFGLLDAQLDLSAVVNGYSSSLNDVIAIGGQADFRLSSEVTLSGGVDYSLYKYDYFTATEREDVWTCWLDVRWKESKDLDVRGRIAVDDDRYHTYTTVELSVRVRF